MPSINDIITKEIKTEGAATNDPTDKGGPTAFGISKTANPEAWKNGAPTEAQARAIYHSKYVDAPGFGAIKDSAIQWQIIDYSINSGSVPAVRRLQEILKVPVDGICGPSTITALELRNPKEVNNLLVAARIKMICEIVQKNQTQIKYLLGWCNRALSFIVW